VLAQRAAAVPDRPGLQLPGVPPTERLEDAGSFGSGNITHRVALRGVDDVDAELEAWLRDAYEVRGR
jgi:hypothetical protein